MTCPLRTGPDPVRGFGAVLGGRSVSADFVSRWSRTRRSWHQITSWILPGYMQPTTCAIRCQLGGLRSPAHPFRRAVGRQNSDRLELTVPAASELRVHSARSAPRAEMRSTDGRSVLSIDHGAPADAADGAGLPALLVHLLPMPLRRAVMCEDEGAVAPVSSRNFDRFTLERASIARRAASIRACANGTGVDA